MKRLFLILISSLFIVSCGGGSEHGGGFVDTTPISVPSQTAIAAAEAAAAAEASAAATKEKAAAEALAAKSRFGTGIFGQITFQ
jgi:hypothetical protein